MQNRYQTYFRDRAIYYLSADIYHQGRKGSEWDYRITPVYGIFLMNFDWREGAGEHLREDVCLMNMKSKEMFSDRLAMTFLKIPMMDRDAADCRSAFDRWLYILKNMEKMEAIPTVFLNDPVFRRLGEVARVAVLGNSERRDYERSLKTYRDNYAIFKTERSEGYAEGKAEGYAEGKAEGIAEGKAEGLAEGEAKFIKRMASNGKTIAEIADLTGYSNNEIEQFLKY